MNWIAEQVYLFAAALAAGALAGAAYHLYSALLGTKRRASRRYLLADALFSLLTTALLALFWFRVTNGTLLLSSFLAMAAGFLLYRALVMRRLRLRPPATPRPAQRRAAPNPRKSRPEPESPLLLRMAAKPTLALLRRRQRLRERLAARLRRRMEEDEPPEE